MNVINIADLFRTVARVHGDQEAIIDDGRTYTYQELDSVVDRTAAHLLGLGVGQGARVGICLLDNADYLITMLAAWRIEATVVPMDWRAKGGERQAAVDRFGVGLVLEHRPPSEAGDYRSVPLDDAWHEAVARAPSVPAMITRSGESVAVLGLSSGTTGQPVGIPTTHEATYARAFLNVINCGLGRQSRFLVTLPLFFTATRTYAITCLLFGGTVIHYGSIFEVQSLCEDAKRHAITHLPLVPTMVRALLDASSPDGLLLPDLECLMCTGSSLIAEEKRAAQELICANVYDIYGATSGGSISFLRPEDIPAHADSVGRPGLHIEVQIVDDQDRPLPAGEPGLLRFSSTMTIANRGAEAVGPEIVRDGWHYPGDLARMDEDGFIHLLGRSADIIIRGGANIYPVEIEDILTAHPAVEQAAVVGWESPVLGEEIAAFVVLCGTAAKADLTAWCRRKLAPTKQPRDIFIRDTLPYNTNGKILKRELKAALPPIE